MLCPLRPGRLACPPSILEMTEAAQRHPALEPVLVSRFRVQAVFLLTRFCPQRAADQASSGSLHIAAFQIEDHKPDRLRHRSPQSFAEKRKQRAQHITPIH